MHVVSLPHSLRRGNFHGEAGQILSKSRSEPSVRDPGFPLDRAQSCPQRCWTLGPKAGQTHKPCCWQMCLEADLEMLCHSLNSWMWFKSAKEPKHQPWFTCLSAGLLVWIFKIVPDFNEDCVSTYRYLWIAAYYNERACMIVCLD